MFYYNLKSAPTQYLSTMSKITRIKNFIYDCLFPIFCLNCGTFIKNEEGRYLCPICLKTIPLHSSLFCPICLKRIGLLKKCSHSDKPSSLDFLAAATDYENPLIQKLIHLYKYQFIKDIRYTLTDIIISYWEKIWPDLKTQFGESLVIPIPLSRQRFKERGFNQSEEIAKIFADHFQLEINNQILVRLRNTPPQAKIENYNDRQLNLQNAFGLQNTLPSGKKNIILVDDVFTSGATMQEAAKVLKQNGAKRIIGLTIAKSRK